MASGLFSSIQSLSTKLLDAIRGTTSPDTNQNESVREDLQKLSQMLARIQAVQQDAEEREIHDRSVRLWLAELRGVAYEAEDVLDEFYYEVLRSIVESGDAAIEAYHRDGGTKRKFAEMHTSSSVASYSFSITKVVIPDSMAEKIKGITEKFQEISNAHRDLHLREEDGNRLVSSTQIRPPTSSHVDERAIFGREEEKENIISVLNPLNGLEFMVLPIVGMGGLGKTTLAQLVYNDSKFLQLFDKRAWVSVSEDFDLVRLTRAIIESINRTTCEFSELNTLQEILKEKIRDVSLFLVLDDMWNENKELWEHFQVPLKCGKTVKVLTTTRNTSVAEIMQTTSPIQLDCLPDEKCWSLLKHFAFDNGEASENGKLLEIGRSIVKKCKGSPLVTKVLGGILRYDMDEEKWREILKSDISEIDENGKILTPLQLSYQKLPLHLKPCFVYLGMFPKGQWIEKDLVVRLWMAQGYINTNSSRTKKTLEEIGSEYLNELQGRSLIDFWKYNTCYVHDLIHDLARSISQRTNLPVLENDNQWNSSYQITHLYLTEKHELSDFLASCNNKVIRTYVREYPRNYKYDWKYPRNYKYDWECPRNYIDDSAIFSRITCVRALQLRNCLLLDTHSTMKHLRYLFIRDDKIESLPESLCLLYHLQTLDINCHNILELPENIKSLINLRFLQFSSKIKQLPESISLPQNLDTLSLELCGELKKLPRSIVQLPNLRVLKLSEYFICNLSSGIGKLTNLITLRGHFKVMGSDMTQGLGELRDMNRLSGVMSISGLNNVGNIEYCRKANLVSKPNLRELILNFEEDDGALKSFLQNEYQGPLVNIVVSSSTNVKNENDEKIQEGVLESLQPHGNLTNLVILNYGGRGFPPWLLDPSLMFKLTTLTLKLQWEFLFLPPFLGQLLHLKSLKIYQSGGSKILFANYSSKQPARITFSSHQPSLYNMLNLREWQAGDEPGLKKLIINKCPKLGKITTPEKVEVLEVNECGCQEIKFSSHSELRRLSISNCRKLITIYYKSGDLPFLESISLSRCPILSMLSAIPQEIKQLDIANCGFQEIKFSSHSELKRLSISNCRKLNTIYYKSGDLPFLESISLSGCPNLLMLSAIPHELKKLDIANCGVQEINFSPLSKLQKILISNCRKLVSIYYKIGYLPFLENISISGCPELLIFSAILEEMKQMDIRNSGFQSEIQSFSISDYREFIPRGTVSLSNCPKLMKFSAIPAVELDMLEIIDCGIREIILPSRCKLLEIHNCPELISVHWRDGDSSSLPLVKFVDCPQLKLLKIPKEVEVLQIKSCGTHEIYFPSQSRVWSVDIYGCPELFSVHWMDEDVPFLKDLFLEACPALRRTSVVPNQIHQLGITECGLHEIQFPNQCNIVSVHISGCSELISLQFLQGDLPLLEKFTIKSCPQFREVLTIPYQLKQLKIVDCLFPEIHLLPQSNLRRLIISECANLIAIKGLQAQFPTGDVSHPMMEMAEIRNCPRMDFGTQGNSYFYQVTQEASQDLGTEEP
ncbi:putative disease resistance protein RGA3 [Carex rostrata]